MLLKLYFEVVCSSNLDNAFYDLFCHAYIVYMSPDFHMKLGYCKPWLPLLTQVTELALVM